MPQMSEFRHLRTWASASVFTIFGILTMASASGGAAITRLTLAGSQSAILYVNPSGLWGLSTSDAVEGETRQYEAAVPGDFPDPSIIRVGDEYWAVATTSGWGPEFPILHSKDLTAWKQVGAVFEERPAWSEGNYWAPEIAAHSGRYSVYYTAKKRNGPLCVAVATDSAPQGPWTDHGPLVCQSVGSIDGVPVDDEAGRRFLIWKEDGNSQKRPTVLWAQPLNADGTKLIGARQVILRNDETWEGQLVEGPFVLRREGFFYLFYSARSCCGRECDYAMGVARSRTLLGPYEKNPGNPILEGNRLWKCPGHGSIVQDTAGRDLLMHHAYHPRSFVYVGRQALIDEVKWGADGWPTINDGNGPANDGAPRSGRPSNATVVADTFDSGKLLPGWQWPQGQKPSFVIESRRGGGLRLKPRISAPDDTIAAVLARSTTHADYHAATSISRDSIGPGVSAGLAAYGDHENALGVAIRDGWVLLWKREKGRQTVLSRVVVPRSETVQFSLDAIDGHRFAFHYRLDRGGWQGLLSASGASLDGAYLPPWDRGVRVALTVGGAIRTLGPRFEFLEIRPIKTHFQIPAKGAASSARAKTKGTTN